MKNTYKWRSMHAWKYIRNKIKQKTTYKTGKLPTDKKITVGKTYNTNLWPKANN